MKIVYFLNSDIIKYSIQIINVLLIILIFSSLLVKTNEGFGKMKYLHPH